ncbi:PREDICTED: protein FAM179B-like [Priapulus caudatus]|uniref:Protein FAM179B-like n=1 Tax=Priapulus caudatus TaxID=37621 RepID=A0ABM1E5E3_PRICU|nr:PREDICTED: protein FAM179B-like [Priapulus caudatus]
MAGTVAKFPVVGDVHGVHNRTQLANSDSRNVTTGNQAATIVSIVSMEESVVIQQLREQKLYSRLDIIQWLRNDLRKNGGRLLFKEKRALFQSLVYTLIDTNWEVKNNAVILISEFIPQFGHELDNCMTVIFPKLLMNISHPKVRRSVIQTVHVYMKYSSDLESVFRGLVKYGLESEDPAVRREITIGLPLLFTPEFANEDLHLLTEALVIRLHDSAGDETAQQPILVSLEKIQELVSEKRFNEFLKKLPDQHLTYYCRITNCDFEEFATKIGRSTNPDIIKIRGRSNSLSQQNNVQFGFVPNHVMDKLSDESDWKARIQGVEELKNILKQLENTNSLVSNLYNFINFLQALLDDVNFKVLSTTLEILELLVIKLKVAVKPVLKPIVGALSKHIGENKTMLKQENMRVIMRLMQTLSPKSVLTVICDQNLMNKNSNVRQETLNIVIASLLTFPSYEFDLAWLCRTLAPTLLDSKRKVRHASLECFATIGQAMGMNKMQPLIQAVDSLELQYDAEGIMSAVQARLARRMLPRLTADQCIEYSLQLHPTSASLRDRGMRFGADIDWIMAGSGGGSARAHAVCQDTGSESPSDTSSNSSLRVIGIDAIQKVDSPGSNQSRFRSAGKRNKLPWDEVGQLDGTFSSDAHQRDSRATGCSLPDGVAPKASVPDGELSGGLATWPKDKGGINGTRERSSPSSVDSSKVVGMTYWDIHQKRRAQQDATETRGPMRAMSQSYGNANNNTDKVAKPRSPSDPGQQIMKSANGEPKFPFASTDNKSDTSKSSENEKIPMKPTLALVGSTKRRKVPSSENLVKLEIDIGSRSDEERWRRLQSDASEAPVFTEIYGTSIAKPADADRNGKPKPNSIRSDISKAVRQSISSPTLSTEDLVHRLPLYKQKADSPQPAKVATREIELRTPPELQSSNQKNGVVSRSAENPFITKPKLGRDEEELNLLSTYPPKKISHQEASVDAEAPTHSEVNKKKDPDEVSHLSQSAKEKIISKQSSVENISEQRDLARQRHLKAQEEKRKQREQRQSEVADPPYSKEAVPNDVSGNLLEVKPVVDEVVPEMTESPHKKQVRRTPVKAATKPPIGPKQGKTKETTLAIDISVNSSLNDTSNSTDELDGQPFTNADSAMKTTFGLLADENWEQKRDGISYLRRLVAHHTDTVLHQLHAVNVAMMAEIKNLRSQVSTAAMVCMRHMFIHLQKNMDTDVEVITKILLHKTGESNTFIREAAERALSAMVENVTHQKALLALVLAGQTHRNPAIRAVQHSSWDN